MVLNSDWCGTENANTAFGAGQNLAVITMGYSANFSYILYGCQHHVVVVFKSVNKAETVWSNVTRLWGKRPFPKTSATSFTSKTY